MNNIEKAPEGGYYPSFYIIELDTFKSPDNFLEDEFFQTLIHEYVHFLQDLFTTYGMARSSNVYSLISSLYYCKKNELHLPIVDYAKYFGEKEPAVINKKLFDLYGNRVRNEFYGFKINHLQFDNIKIIEDIQKIAERDVKLYKIKLLKGNEEVFCFPFGADTLIESMADLIEQTMYPRKSKCYLIPYDLPKIVVKYFNKNYNNRQLFLLCYTSLMIYNSAEWFINVLKKNHLRFDKIEDLDETLKYDSHKSFQLIFSEERERLKESIKGLFNFEDKSFYDARDWVLSWLNNDNAETENYYFFNKFLTMFEMKNLNEIKTYFCYLLKGNISPPICNKSGEVAVMAKKNKAIMNNNISLWLYIKNMYNYVFDNKYSMCTNCDICNKQGNICDDCLDYPLKKRINRKPICIFRQMYQSWGLYKHIVKKENDFCYPIRYTPKN